MISSNSKPLSTPFNFLKEHYGSYQLSFFQLQNGSLIFLYQDDILYIRAEVGADSTIYMAPQINFNTSDINWRYISVHVHADDNTIESWVANDYKWS